MLAYPAKAGARSPSLVHKGLNVNTNFSFRPRKLLFNPFEKPFQLLAYDIVIVIAPCVARDFAGRRFLGMLLRREIVERHDDDRTCFSEKFSRVCSLLCVARHPSHLAMKPAPKPFFQLRMLFH